jgi:hypothetical protein
MLYFGFPRIESALSGGPGWRSACNTSNEFSALVRCLLFGSSPAQDHRGGAFFCRASDILRSLGGSDGLTEPPCVSMRFFSSHGAARMLTHGGSAALWLRLGCSVGGRLVTSCPTRYKPPCLKVFRFKPLRFL